MCGITGVLDLDGRQRVDAEAIAAMTGLLVHRGPDSGGSFVTPDFGLGVRRLKIIDLATGDQPLFNEDRSLVLACNGEIFNYRELRQTLAGRGHHFQSKTDVEVVLHLYEEIGDAAVERLNGQFAFALYDRRRRRLLLARDHFGVNPLYTCQLDGLLLFGSEIKSILAHPLAPRQVDLVGLDQVFSLPGLVSPRTLFAGISSLPSGHRMIVEGGRVGQQKYWDLDYPLLGEEGQGSEEHYVEALAELFRRSVERRLMADVPVGFYVSGGVDSTLVACVGRSASSQARASFSIAFDDPEIDEAPYQRLVARALDTAHHEIRFDRQAILSRLETMVYHCECPVKETFDTCALALAEAAHAAGVKVILAGEGADELFGGYPGYRFDAAQGNSSRRPARNVEEALEEELRARVWGDRHLFYEKDQIAFRGIKAAMYSAAVNERFAEVDCLSYPLVDHDQIRGRHVVHQRSFLDCKLRLADHLLSEHGDRMTMAHSVEGRFPFLDVELFELVRRIPPSLKVNGLVDKYIVRRMATGVIPERILKREKLGFRAPGTPSLLAAGDERIADLLSYDCIRRQGYFDPEVVERLKAQYTQPGFRLHAHLETDLLMIVLTFGMLCDRFDLPSLR